MDYYKIDLITVFFPKLGDVLMPSFKRSKSWANDELIIP